MAWGRYTREFSLLDTQTFTSSTTYTLPTNYKFIRYACIGAGGGGGGANSYYQPQIEYASPAFYIYYGGAGGNGGPFHEGFWRIPVGLTTLAVVVGAGGACNTAGGFSAIGSLVFVGSAPGVASNATTLSTQGAASAGNAIGAGGGTGGNGGYATGGTDDGYASLAGQ